MTTEEWEEIQRDPKAASVKTTVIHEGAWVRLQAGPCPFYRSGCTIYEIRPYNCRRFSCGRWEPDREPFMANPMVLIRGNNDLRWSYRDQQRAAQPWAKAHGWREDA